MIAEQRTHAGRLYLASVVLAYAFETRDGAEARTLRDRSRGFGSMASFLGDETALNWVSDVKHEELRTGLRVLSDAALHLAATGDVTRFVTASASMFDAYF
jgi:hypothetical protein